MGRAKRRDRHEPDVVAAHIRQHHPRCPELILGELVRRVSERVWNPKATLGHAVGMVMTNFIRHELTDYEKLMRKHGLTREEARLIVQQEVRDIVASWGRVPESARLVLGVPAD